MTPDPPRTSPGLRHSSAWWPRTPPSTWVRLDNAANIFLATRSDIDTKVFRLAAELDEMVDPAVLQEALDRVYAQYPLFRAVLRQGIFWYYLQESDRHPVVAEDVAPSVTHLYRFDSRDLLFRVLHRGHRISLEVFHALTDGTGALWFFQDLLTEYLGLRHPEEFAAAALTGRSGVKQEFTVDAFSQWFGSRRGAGAFIEEATTPVGSTSSLVADNAGGPVASHEKASHPHTRSRRVVRVRGRLTPDRRTRVVEVSVPVRPMLDLARAQGVSLTIYLIALFFESLRATRVLRREARTMAVSVPVNLRQFFPSASGRNFFATIRLMHQYRADSGADSLGAVCRSLNEQFQSQLTQDGLQRKIRRLVRFERHPLLRFIPRPLKDAVLGAVNHLNNRGITVAISNLGRVALPAPADPHVRRMFLHVSAARPQLSAISHGDVLTVSFTSPFVETDYHAAFVRHLTDRGVAVRVNASRVTAQELAEAEGDPSRLETCARRRRR